MSGFLYDVTIAVKLVKQTSEMSMIFKFRQFLSSAYCSEIRLSVHGIINRMMVL